MVKIHHGQTDGQPENITPLVPKGGGIINQNILGKVDNTIATNALALCVFRSPKLVLLSIWDKQVLALHGEAFELPMPFDLIVRNVRITNNVCMFADEWIQSQTGRASLYVQHD